MSTLYPSSFNALSTWAREHNIAATEARLRFAQYVMLRAIAESRALSTSLVFKGGNALDFMWQPNRSTLDLDFSTARKVVDVDAEGARLGELFARALTVVEREFGVFCRVTRVDRQPPGPDKTFVTYHIRIAYALPDQARLRHRMEADPRLAHQGIEIEVSINEPICADQPFDIAGTHPLRVSSVEDIVAEKLRALLQQPIRNRTRPQDLLDIAVVIRTWPLLDHIRVADFLQRKAAARNVPVSRAAFHNPEIMARAKQGYAELAATTREVFIPFDEALAMLYAFIDHIDIPAE